MAPSLGRLVINGLSTFVREHPTGTGGTTVSASYCYSVYLRHLVMAERNGLPTDPQVVAEIGPGESIGIGLTAMLCGAERFFAFDVVEHASVERNIAVFDELVGLLRDGAPIPVDGVCADIKPKLVSYAFPHAILGQARLERTLAPGRIDRLRAALLRGGKGEPIEYMVPWLDTGVVQPGTVDLIVSQAVMEHIDALEEAYAACWRWLKPGGFMSHQIDFRSHDTAPEWNGHWAYSDLTWWAIRGARPWLLNRIPHSEHIRLMRAQGFEILCDLAVRAADGISRRRLARRFRQMSDDDLAIQGAFIQARRPLS